MLYELIGEYLVVCNVCVMLRDAVGCYGMLWDAMGCYGMLCDSV